MAEFVQTMKDWRRMCKHYSDESMKAGQSSCVDMCPLGHNTVCGIIEDALDSDIEATAKEVAKWATENPEPVYPTWWEWLYNINAVAHKLKPDVAEKLIDTGLLEPIPADIASKLGIQPKEAKE